MYRLKTEINGYLQIEVIAATPAQVREDAVQLLHKLNRKHAWTPEALQRLIAQVEDPALVIEDLTGGYISVDFEQVWL